MLSFLILAHCFESVTVQIYGKTMESFKKKSAFFTNSLVDGLKQNFNILIVEDSKLIREIVIEFLKMIGFTNITAVDTGKEALVKYKKCDLILLDVGLPDISGIEVCRMIRMQECKTKKRIPIIIITAYGSSVKQKCYEEGIDAFLVKPVTVEKLSNLLNHYVKNIKQGGNNLC